MKKTEGRKTARPRVRAVEYTGTHTDDTRNANPGFFVTRLPHCHDDDGVRKEEHRADSCQHASRLRRSSEEQERHDEARQRHARVAEGEEVRAPRVKAGRGHEEGYQHHDPPEEGDDCEEDGEEADGAHAPQVVGRHGRVVGSQIGTGLAVNPIREQPGPLVDPVLVRRLGAPLARPFLITFPRAEEPHHKKKTIYPDTRDKNGRTGAGSKTRQIPTQK